MDWIAIELPIIKRLIQMTTTWPMKRLHPAGINGLQHMNTVGKVKESKEVNISSAFYIDF